MKKATAELKVLVKARGPRLMDLRGVGPVVAARTLADVGDIARFADRNRFASWTGTAPLDASSGEQNRHRLSRAGNRRMNHMIHIAAATQIRLDTPGRAYYRRKIAAGKSRREAMRCLKRRISDALYRQLRADSAAAVDAGPGGHSGAALQSSAAGLHPHTGTSDQPLSRTRTNDATRAHDHAEDHRAKGPRTRPLTSEGCRSDAPLNSAIAVRSVAQANRTVNCPLACCLETTLSLRDSTKSRNVVNPSDFSVKAGSIRCIWLLTPAA